MKRKMDQNGLQNKLLKTYNINLLRELAFKYFFIYN